jgi:hypothetical protein
MNRQESLAWGLLVLVGLDRGETELNLGWSFDEGERDDPWEGGLPKFAVMRAMTLRLRHGLRKVESSTSGSQTVR